ncbi:MAG: hypothetical protein H0U92_00815 [Actinobacteria bacterium]|nr:hypothetical protein [Actinomycetota bacterium]
MTPNVQTRSKWRRPVRLAAAGIASVLVVVSYLSGVGGDADAVDVRRVSEPAMPTTQPTVAPTSTSAVVPASSSHGVAAAPTAPAVARKAAPKTAATQTRATPESAVLDWVDAVGRGDVKTAAALVGRKSRRYIESLGGNVEGFMKESQEGYGGWVQSSDRQTTEIELGAVDNAPTTIVVLSGTSRGEGSDGFRTDAIPAVRIGGGWMVEPTAFRSDTGGRLELVTPTRASDGRLATMQPDGVISANALGTGDFYFSLEDQPAARVQGERAGGGARATWDPPGDMAAHRHLLVVAYADGDTLTAFAGVFDVA